MEKDESIKIEDSNIAMLGSEIEKQVKLEAAKTEEAWTGSGEKLGLDIWRIEQFKVVPWPKDQYGNFFSGDSYIVLNTYKKEGTDCLLWNAHMWVGQESTMDEQGTAAYKIVELDDLFNREIVLSRETQGNESELFLSYFKVLTIMDGGVESGFKKVPVEKYRPRLLHVRGKANCRVLEVTLKRESLNAGDVFILDDGLTIYNWRGVKCNSYEKFKASSVCESIRAERNGKAKVIAIEQGEEDERFWELLGGKGEIKEDIDVNSEKVEHQKKMLHLSDSSGTLEMKPVDFKKSSLDTNDVFIVDIGYEILIWVGKKCTVNEKKNSFVFAQKYMTDNGRPNNLPICSMIEGKETKLFEEVLA